MRSERNRRNNRLASIAVLSSAVVSVVGSAVPTLAATDTWAGTILDTSHGSVAPGSVVGSGAANWDTSTANWLNGGTDKYTVGDNVVFTDKPTGTSDLEVTSGNLNPGSMTFAHDPAGSAITYIFHINGDVLPTTPPYVGMTGASTPFGTNDATVLTLDTGFLGTVILKSRATSGPGTGPNSTIIKSGTLEIDDGAALPNLSNNSNPLVTLAGGQLDVNVGTGGISSGQLSRGLTVTANSILANSAPTNSATASLNSTGAQRLWSGSINTAAGVALTIESINGTSINLAATLNNAADVGTIAFADVGTNITTVTFSGTNTKSQTAAFNLGTGQSQIQSGLGSVTIDLGSLLGGPGTKLAGGATSGSLTTYSIGMRGDSTTFAGTVLDGTVAGATTALLKVGAGTLTLTGTDTYTGTTTVNAGTLAIAGTGRINSGTIALTTPSNSTTIATFKLDSSTVNNSDRINDTAVVTMSRANLVFVGNLANPTSETAGSLLISNGLNEVQTIASGSGSPASLNFTGATSFSRTGGVVDFNLDPNVNVTFAGMTNGLIGGYATYDTNDWAAISSGAVTAFTGYANDDGVNNGAGTWNSAQNINLTNTTPESIAAPTTINLLKISGIGAKNISINAGQSLDIAGGGILATGTSGATIAGPGTLTAGTSGVGGSLIALVQDPNNTLTISSPISDNGVGGTVGLIKAGAGTLVLASANNSFTGGTQLLAGTLKVAVANFFGATPQALTINFGTAFDIGGFNQAVTTLTLVNGSVLNSGGSATLSGTAFAVQNGLISTSLAGTGTLTKSTTGIVTLSASNAYTGGTSITAGTLALAAAGAFPSGGTLSISGGGTLDIGTNNVTTGVASLTNGGIAGTGIVTGTSFLANGSQTFTVSAVLAGTGATLTKGVTDGVSNGGTLTLTNNNTYTGATTIGATGTTSMLQGGFVIVNSLADGGLPSGIGASTSDPSNLVLNNGELIYTGAGGSTNRSFTIAAGTYGGILSSGTGPLTLSFTGAITTSGGTLDLDGTFAGANTFDPDITGTTNLLKQGVTEWQILGTRGYSGSTTIQNGTLTVDTIANGTQPSGIGVSDNTSGNLIFTGGGLNYIGAGASTDRLFSLNGSSGGKIFSSGTGPLVFTNTNPISVNNSASGAQGHPLTLAGNNTGLNVFMPTLTDGGGSLTLTKSGNGFWQLTATNTYTGGTTVTAGTLLTNTNFSNGSFTVSGGTARVAHQAGINDSAAGATYLLYNNNSVNNGFFPGTFSISGTGKLDLNNNALILDYVDPTIDSTSVSPISSVRTQLIAGAASGSWTGATGISSSDAAASQGSGHPMALGYAEASSITATSIGGHSLDGSDVVVAYTYAGDANLDGVVNVEDFNALSMNYNATSSNASWLGGDFNYDGKVNAEDFALLAANYGATAAFTASAPALGTLVPEPTTLGLLAAFVPLALRRRRK